MKKIAVAVILAFASCVFAISPQFWQENTQSEFASGDPHSISINSDGELTLSPQMKRIYEGKDAIIWKIVRDSKGNIYAGTGNEGKVIKIDPSGKASTILDTKELEVQALVVDKNDDVFVATSPDGKIYKLKPSGESSVFFDPDDKYIWSLALDRQGNLYAGTGDQGKIYAIDKNGKGKVLVDTTERNITALCWSPADKLLAGSDKNGILYSIEKNGKAFVLYDSELQQITSIYATPTGEIFFSAINAEPTAAPAPKPVEETVTKPAATPTPPPSDEEEGPDQGSVEVVTTVDMGQVGATATATPQRQAGASQLYRMKADGFTEVIYNSEEDQILDIVGYHDDQVLLSTGKKGKLISVDVNKKSTILVKASEEQITSLLRAGDQVWAATANPGNVYQLVEEHSASGTYYSDVKDSQTTSRWGRITWKASTPAGTTLTLATRTGNTKTPDETWSDWESAGTNQDGAKIKNPNSRFVQWKADFATKDPKISPTLRKVSIAFLQQNLRPQVLTIMIYPPGVVFRKQPIYGQESYAGLPENATVGQETEAAGGGQGSFEMPLGKREIHRGFQTITWNAVDQNQDELVYDLYYRNEDEKDWKPLAKRLTDKVFAWDTQTVADGSYIVKVVASDSPSNPKDLALTGEKESDSFDVDNQPPAIEVLKDTKEKGVHVLEVQAKDQFSPIHDMAYSIVPGEWIIIFPEDYINDSPLEKYRIELKDLPANIKTVMFKCSDSVRNTTTVKYTLK